MRGKGEKGFRDHFGISVRRPVESVLYLLDFIHRIRVHTRYTEVPVMLVYIILYLIHSPIDRKSKIWDR